MTVIAIIPARGGSKGIPRKNLVPIAGRPLIAYTIDAARAARSLDKVIVSTDDQEIADVAKTLGAEVPFMRPAALAADTTPMLAVLTHALEWAEKHGDKVDAVVLLQPTSPLRAAKHIDEAVALFFKHEATSVVSVTEVPHQFNPLSVLTLEDGVLQPFMGKNAPTRRQDKPRVYARNGPAVLVCDPKTLTSGELYGEKCMPYLMRAAESPDIDEASDIPYVEWLLQRKSDG